MRALAELVALAAPSRPSVYFAADPDALALGHAPPTSAIRARWLFGELADTNPAPPPEIKAQFPDLVPEVPRTFARPVRGRLPPLLIGWGVIRPASAPVPANAPPR